MDGKIGAAAWVEVNAVIWPCCLCCARYEHGREGRYFLEHRVLLLRSRGAARRLISARPQLQCRVHHLRRHEAGVSAGDGTPHCFNLYPPLRVIDKATARRPVAHHVPRAGRSQPGRTQKHPWASRCRQTQLNRHGGPVRGKRTQRCCSRRTAEWAGRSCITASAPNGNRWGNKKATRRWLFAFPRLLAAVFFKIPLISEAGFFRRNLGRRDWTRTNDPHHVKVVL